MNITICGSISFFNQMLELKNELEQLRHHVETPDLEGLNTNHSELSEQEHDDLKRSFINAHLEKIRQSDAILIANYTKNGQENYIGANTFLEMGMAYALGKKIYILYDMPHQQNNTEMRGLLPTLLKSDLEKIT